HGRGLMEDGEDIALPDREDLPDLHRVVDPAAEVGAEELPRPCLPAASMIRHVRQRVSGDVPRALGMNQFEPAVEVAGEDEIESPLHDLHVLLRHPYSDSPAASRASSGSGKPCIARATPSRNVQM